MLTINSAHVKTIDVIVLSEDLHRSPSILNDPYLARTMAKTHRLPGVSREYWATLGLFSDLKNAGALRLRATRGEVKAALLDPTLVSPQLPPTQPPTCTHTHTHIYTYTHPLTVKLLCILFIIVGSVV